VIITRFCALLHIRRVAENFYTSTELCKSILQCHNAVNCTLNVGGGITLLTIFINSGSNKDIYRIFHCVFY